MPFMQADRFTTKVQEAFAAAQRLATQHRNTEVAPPHLLVALLESEDGMTAPILRRVGGDPLAIEQGARDLVEGLATVSGTEPVEPRFSQSLARVLQRAEREMTALGDEYIAANHLLLALAEKSSGVGDLLPDREQLAKAANEVVTNRITTPIQRPRSMRSGSSART
jgi:ATP-dependent Clp protease ATP-binding subunit ClpB